MERYNLFHLIHNSLRASLYHTALQLQQADFTDKAVIDDASERIGEIMMLFEGHARKEENFVFPAIAIYEPAVAACFETEHQEDERFTRELRTRLTQLETASTLLERLSAGKELNDAFVTFTVCQLKHMAHEEKVINPILWRYYTDEEIKAINAAIASSIEPWIQDFYSTWMIRGINDRDALELVKAVERTAAEPAFLVLLQKLEQEWTPGRFKKFEQALSEGALIE